jgi:16S rRNA (adenine1518-N6/adenine1519-N6)-dimethyltransferase
MDRLHPDHLKNRLKEAGVWSKQQLGQHFLIDHITLQAVVDAADVQPGDVVVEIGPGLGVLTEKLLQIGAVVHACELDPAMSAIITADFRQFLNSGQLILHEGDALRILPQLLPELPSYKVVANIPYQITTPLIEILLEKGPRPTVASMLIQKEVAVRLAAQACESDRSFLSVLCQYFADIALIHHVPPRAFFPPPAVDSAVIRLLPRLIRALPEEQEQKFFKFVRMSFQQRRKQLKNVLAGVRGKEVSVIEKQLLDLGLPQTIRAQELSEAQWVSLYQSGL